MNHCQETPPCVHAAGVALKFYCVKYLLPSQILTLKFYSPSKILTLNIYSPVKF